MAEHLANYKECFYNYKDKGKLDEVNFFKDVAKDHPPQENSCSNILDEKLEQRASDPQYPLSQRWNGDLCRHHCQRHQLQ